MTSVRRGQKLLPHWTKPDAASCPKADLVSDAGNIFVMVFQRGSKKIHCTTADERKM